MVVTIKSNTDLEQSKKLAGFLSHERADMFIADVINPKEQSHSYNFHVLATWGCNTFEGMKGIENKFVSFTPAWSLAALFSVLPEIQGGKPTIALDDNYIAYPHMNLYAKADNLIDACYEMICQLHELKLL